MGGDKFLNLYRETFANKVQGAALLIHDLGSNPNSPSVMKPFRNYLSDHGWTTLSLQMPVLDAGSRLVEYYDQVPEATKRVLAGVEFLGNHNIRNVVIIGYGFGAMIAPHFLATHNAPTVTALVIISLPMSNPNIPNSQIEGVLDKVDIPIFDINFNRENARRQEALKKRKRLMRSNKNYRQLLTNEAGFQFRDSGRIMVKRVYSWLMRVAPGVEIR